MQTPPMRWPSRPYSLTPDRLLAVRREHRLSPSCCLVLQAVVSHDHALAGGRTGLVWPSVDRLAELCGLSPRQTQRHLATLAERGLVTPEPGQHGGRSRAARRRVQWAALVPGGPGPRPVETPSPAHRPARETPSPAPGAHKDRKPGERETRPRGAALAGAAPTGGPAEAARTPRPSARVAADLTPAQREEVRLRVAAERDPVARCRRMAEALAALADAAG